MYVIVRACTIVHVHGYVNEHVSAVTKTRPFDELVHCKMYMSSPLTTLVFTFKPSERQENKTFFAPNEKLSKSKIEKNLSKL